MNRTTLAVGMALVGSVFWFDRHAAWRVSAEQAKQTRIDIAQLQSTAAAIQTEIAARQSELQALQQRIAANRRRLAELAAPAPASAAPAAAPIDGGAWPVDQPYFLLRKDRLQQIRFDVLDERGDISAVAAALFGMTLAEHIEALTAWRDHRRQIEELQLTRAERVETPPPASATATRSVTYRIPALADEAASATDEFKARLEGLLGVQRASMLSDLLLDENLVADLKQEREISYVVNPAAGSPVKRQLIVRTATGAMYVPIADEPYPTDETHPLWRYRHLFGSEELAP